MAGSTLDYPLNGAANWEAFPDIVQKIQAGYMRLGLTHFDDADEPEIAAGSTLDVNGACCVFSAAESITGWAGIANSTDVYIKVVVTGAVVTAEFTTDAPTWSVTKQGWYDGNDRYIGGLYKDGSGDYTIKWLYPENPSDPINQEMIRGGETRPLLEKVFEIGVWDMDTTNVATINLNMPNTKVREYYATIMNDAQTNVYPLTTIDISMTLQGGIHNVYSSPHSVRLYRLETGIFDAAVFDDGVMNRGWLLAKYRA